MVSEFQGLWAEGRRNFDLVFGETFAITPMIQFGNARPAIDTTRSPTTFTGIFTEDSDSAFGSGPGHAQNTSQKVVAGHPTILMSASSLPYVVSSRDIVTRPGTGDIFEVSTVQPDHFGRVTIMLTARHPATP